MKYWEIGPALQRQRKARGWTQTGLADAVGITRVTLGKLERGKLAGISLGAVIAILDQFGMELEFRNSGAMPTLEDLAARLADDPSGGNQLSGDPGENQTPSST